MLHCQWQGENKSYETETLSSWCPWINWLLCSLHILPSSALTLNLKFGTNQSLGWQSRGSRVFRKNLYLDVPTRLWNPHHLSISIPLLAHFTTQQYTNFPYKTPNFDQILVLSTHFSPKQKKKCLKNTIFSKLGAFGTFFPKYVKFIKFRHLCLW